MNVPEWMTQDWFMGAAVETAVDRETTFAALVEQQSRFVFRVAYAILRNAHDAEDVVQDTFLRLYKAGGWDRIEDERAYLARSAWRLAVERRGKRRVEPLDVDVPSDAVNAEQTMVTNAMEAIVHRLVDALPEELRQPLALSTVDGMSSKKIAEVMGIAEGTVRTRIMRARQILKDKLLVLGGRYGQP
jgi:RNA polymerase sigma-70 factor (ECF subfamily)